MARSLSRKQVSGLPTLLQRLYFDELSNPNPNCAVYYATINKMREANLMKCNDKEGGLVRYKELSK